MSGRSRPARERSPSRRPWTTPGRGRSGRAAGASCSTPRACSRGGRASRRADPLGARPASRCPCGRCCSRPTRRRDGARPARDEARRRPAGRGRGGATGCRPAQPRPGDAVGQRHRPCLGGDCQEVVTGNGDAERPEPIAVERGPAGPAVCEAERSRPVPWLAEHRPVAMEVPNVVIEPRVVLPCGGTSTDSASAMSPPSSRTRSSSALSRSAESEPSRSSAGASAGLVAERSRALPST